MFKKKKSLLKPQMSSQDVLEALPIPPVGTLWKIEAGTHYISTAYIDINKSNTFPFVLSLIKDDTASREQGFANIGIRVLQKDHINMVALKILAFVLNSHPEYTMVQPTDGAIAQNLNIVGYYSANRTQSP